MNAMATLVLQGPRLTRANADTFARQVCGELYFGKRFARIAVETAPSRAELHDWRQRYDFDINAVPEAFRPDQTKLLVTDMDSTLISIECIDEIADFLGIKPQVAAITEAAMRGELDFEGSLTRRVALLKNLDVAALEHVYTERLRLNPGAEIMLQGLQAQGIKVALVSGGFTFFTQRLQERLRLDYTLANVLDIEHGKLTGRVAGTIVGAEGKAAFLRRLTAELQLQTQQTMAMGDGANDLKMMHEAGLSIAYHAKPTVQAQATAVINHCGLDGVLGLLGIDG
jgi:phosphoserine phosphatase